VRSRGGGGAKSLRFIRVTGLQRAIAVRTSDSGALAALREPYPPPDITPVGNNLAEDLARLRPYFSFTRPEDEGRRIEPMLETSVDPMAVEPLPDVTVTVREEEEEGDGGGFDLEAELLARDAREVKRLWDILAQDRIARRRPRHEAGAFGPGQGQGLFAKSKLSHGADLMLCSQNSTELPAHRIVLSARCAVLARVLGGLGSLHDRESGVSFKLLPAPVQRIGARASCPPRTSSEAPRLAITGVHPFSILILLHYLYTDMLLAINDPQLARLTGTADAFAHGRLQPAQAVRELLTLSRVLHLEALADPLRSVVRRAPPLSLNSHYRAIFDAPMTSVSSDVDVVLRLADRDVRSHSFVLRARSLFFECFFADEEWTRDRWESDGILHVDLRHLEWRAMQYVLRFMCCGEEAEMFERLGMWIPTLPYLAF
jgi:inhibitor of Bruton tyrosine kinase